MRATFSRASALAIAGLTGGGAPVEGVMLARSDSSAARRSCEGGCESRGREGTVRRVSRVARGGGTRAVATAVFQVVWLPLRRSTSEDLRITHLIVRQDAERLALLRCCATGKEIDVRFGAIVGPRSRAIRRARAQPSPLARLASNALVLSIVFLSLLGARRTSAQRPGRGHRRSGGHHRSSRVVPTSDTSVRKRRDECGGGSRASPLARANGSASEHPRKLVQHSKNSGRSASASSGAVAGIFECIGFVNQEFTPYGQPRARTTETRERSARIFWKIRRVGRPADR